MLTLLSLPCLELCYLNERTTSEKIASDLKHRKPRSASIRSELSKRQFKKLTVLLELASHASMGVAFGLTFALIWTLAPASGVSARIADSNPHDTLTVIGWHLCVDVRHRRHLDRLRVQGDGRLALAAAAPLEATRCSSKCTGSYGAS